MKKILLLVCLSMVLDFSFAFAQVQQDAEIELKQPTKGKIGPVLEFIEREKIAKELKRLKHKLTVAEESCDKTEALVLQVRLLDTDQEGIFDSADENVQKIRKKIKEIKKMLREIEKEKESDVVSAKLHLVREDLSMILSIIANVLQDIEVVLENNMREKNDEP